MNTRVGHRFELLSLRRRALDSGKMSWHKEGMLAGSNGPHVAHLRRRSLLIELVIKENLMQAF